MLEIVFCGFDVERDLLLQVFKAREMSFVSDFVQEADVQVLAINFG